MIFIHNQCFELKEKLKKKLLLKSYAIPFDFHKISLLDNTLKKRKYLNSPKHRLTFK